MAFAFALALPGPVNLESVRTSGEPPEKFIPLPDGGSIEGVVKDSSNRRRPIAGASITLLCECLPHPLETLTDKRGAYAFEGLPEGNFIVSVRVGQILMVKPLELAESSELRANFPIRHKQRKARKRRTGVEAPPSSNAQPKSSAWAGEIQGIVTNTYGGEPVVNALVVLQCRCLTRVRQRLTDEYGMYRFAELPQGDYSIRVVAGKGEREERVSLDTDARERIDVAIDPLGI
jgi:hypothetical protein